VFYFSSSFYETEKGVYAAVQSAAIDVSRCPGARGWDGCCNSATEMAGTTAEHPPSIAKKNGWSHGGTPAINC
jgi:hypothetical protein